MQCDQTVKMAFEDVSARNSWPPAYRLHIYESLELFQASFVTRTLTVDLQRDSLTVV